MKYNCDIVRDLMPMCIDGTASDKTKQMVDEHVAECPPCDKVYAEMRGEAKLELPVQSAAPEFASTVKKMKSRRKRRTWLTLLLGVMIAGLVALAGLYGYYWYFVDWTLLEDAQLSLVSSTDGIALIHARNVPRSANMVLRMSEMEYPDSAKGQCECLVFISATRYEAKNKGDDVYFVVGNMEEDRVLAIDEWNNEVPVYRMLLARRYDGSGQVFYLSGEEEPEVISLRGAHLKSPDRSYYTNNTWSESVPYTFATLQPMSSWSVELQDGNAVTRKVTPLPAITPTPTPGPVFRQEEPPATTITPTPEP